MKIWLLTVLLIIGTFLIGTSVFQVHETQLCSITQFGKPVKQISSSGLHWKLPLPFQKKVMYDKRIRIFNPKPMEFLTADKQNIIIDGFITWRIDSKKLMPYVRSLGSQWNVSLFLTDLFTSEMGAAMGRYKMENLISTDSSLLKQEEIIQSITQNCAAVSASNGLEILAVRIKKLNIPEGNKESVYARMTEERKRIAKKFRAEGEEKSMVIIAEADKEKVKLLSESKKKADEVLGEAEAEAAGIYAKAHTRNPEFYSFLRTLEAYEKFMDEKTTVILSRDSELLKLFTTGK